MSRVLNLLFPQWQGAGAIPGVHSGALALHHSLECEEVFTRVPVDMKPVGASATSNIFARDQVATQLRHARSLIEAAAPERIFMIGGDCGTEVAPISYLARRHGLELAVIWLDAHPDLHTPCSSPTKTFHGMPLRTLLGEGDDLILQYAGPAIEPHQIFLCGVRDADPAELEYLAANRSVSHHSIEELSVSAEGLIGSLKSMGFKKLYIHIDLDVLDPAAFPHVPCPTPGGLSLQSLQAVVKCLASEFEIVGLSLLEFLATRSEQTAKAASDAETIARLVWRTFQDQL